MEWTRQGSSACVNHGHSKAFLKITFTKRQSQDKDVCHHRRSNFANTLPDRKPTAIMYLSWKTTVISLKLQSCLRIPSSATTTITHPSVSCPPTYPLASAKPCIPPFLDCSFFFCAVSDISCSRCLLISSDMLLLFEWAQGRRVLGEGEEFHTHYIAKILTRDLNGQITYIAKKGFSVSYCRSNSFKAGYKNCSEMASSSWDSRISVSAGAEITDFYVVNVSCG